MTIKEAEHVIRLYIQEKYEHSGQPSFETFIDNAHLSEDELSQYINSDADMLLILLLSGLDRLDAIGNRLQSREAQS